MRSRRIWVAVAVLVCGSVAADPPHTNTTFTSAVSLSRQFHANAAGPVLPTALCVFAERIKREWLFRLDAKDDWRDPVLLVVRERTASNTTAAAISLRIRQISTMLEYDLTCRVPPPLDEVSLATAIVEVLCLEVANRNCPRDLATPCSSAAVPLWLSQGLAQSIQGQPEWLLAVARRAGTAVRPPPISAVMQITALPADPVERDLFRANAWLLTESLLRLPGGSRHLREFLVELGRAKSFADAFQTIYGSTFPNEVALEKWWSLQQARLATILVPQNLTATETTQRLDSLLTLEGGLQFNALDRFSERAWLKKLLSQRIAEMEGLLSRAHPMYRPVVTAYINAARLLVEEKVSRYHRTVRQAEQLREEVDRQILAMTEVLDRTERTSAPDARTNTFQGFFRTLDEAQQFKQQRRGPISDYLDKFDK